MRAIVTERTGSPDVMKLRDVPDPVPTATQVVIEVAYCGCNWGDTQIRAGNYPHPMSYPMILGYEVSGVISSIGPGVTDFLVGDRVCAISASAGGYAERLAVDQNYLVPLPDDMPLDVAAAFPIQALTAYHLLHTIYHVKAGDTVLYHSIGGGMGLYIAQLGRLAGARVIGTVGTPGKEVLPLSFGAERVVNTVVEDFVEAAREFTDGVGIDVAIDALGAKTLDRTFETMRKLGHVISIGEAEGLPFNNLRERLMAKSLTFTRFNLGHLDPTSLVSKNAYAAVMGYIADGSVKVPIVERFPFEKAVEMHRRIEGRGVSGKLLLAVQA
jgi:NADPH2:quinone reductase